jgi:hypothetical protein
MSPDNSQFIIASYLMGHKYKLAAHEHAAPLKSPNADTSSNYAYNIANNASPQRRTFPPSSQ